MRISVLVIILATLGKPVFGVTAFTDRTLWENALSATIVTETFDSDIAEGPDLIVFASGVQSQGVSLNDGTGDNAVAGGQWSGNVRYATSANTGYVTITWTFPQAINAFAADFSSIANGRGLEIVADWDGAGEQGFNLRDNVGPAGFLGLIGTSTFSQIRFDINEATASIAGNDVFDVDNAAFTPIPEPSALSVGLLGLGLILLKRPRRRWA